MLNRTGVNQINNTLLELFFNMMIGGFYEKLYVQKYM